MSDATTAYIKNPTKPVPFYGRERCYACDAKPVGYADRRHSPERELVEACQRHRDPTIRVYEACSLCMGVMRKGGLQIDGVNVHAKCHREASK